MVRFGKRGGNAQSGGTGSKVSTGKILTAVSALLLPLWLLAGGVWIVQVVGLGFCQAGETNGSHYLQFDWFVTAFEVVVLLLLPWPLIARRVSPGITALLAVVTVLEILRTNVWNDARLAGSNLNGGSGVQIDSVINPGLSTNTKRVQTVFAGYLMVSAVNLLLILGLGLLPAPSAQDAQQVEDKARATAEQHQGDKYNSNTAIPPGYNNGVGHGAGAGGMHHNNVGQV